MCMQVLLHQTSLCLSLSLRTCVRARVCVINESVEGMLLFNKPDRPFKSQFACADPEGREQGVLSPLLF